jgi:hypothetical protein
MSFRPAYIYTDWWFGTFFIFHVGKNNPNWLIFFRGVETTNQYIYIYYMLYMHVYVFMCIYIILYIIVYIYICFKINNYIYIYE